MKKLISLFVVATFCYIPIIAQIGFEEHVILDETEWMEGARSIFAIDLDGDNDLDILASQVGKIVWFENLDSVGNLGPQKIIASDFSSQVFLKSIDIDFDGDSDILSADFGDNEIALFRNDGNGNFSNKVLISNTLISPLSIDCGDFDGDGDIDVVALGRIASEAYLVWYENIDGSYSDQTIIDQGLGSIAKVYTSDIDGDGDSDLVLSRMGANGINWYDNIDGLGNFAPNQIVSGQITNVWTLHISDIDNDGDNDIISGATSNNNNTSNLNWHENLDGQGNFSDPISISTQVSSANVVYSTDIDSDGDIDVLTASFNNITWYENIDGQGTFSPDQILSESSILSYGMHAGDIDGNGTMDIVASNNGQSEISWFPNISGQGDFGEEVIINQSIYNPENTINADLDGDGDDDVIVCSSGDRKVSWFENTNGKGKFGEQNIISGDLFRINSAYPVDMDNDGDQDLVTLQVSADFDGISWFENIDGAGNFGPQNVLYTNSGRFDGIAVADFDGDGDADIVSTRFSNLEWHENINGLGEFADAQEVVANVITPKAVITADMDGDGDQDILNTNFSTHIPWYENLDGNGNFSEPKNIEISSNGSKHIHVEDLNSDGYLDLIYVSNSGDHLAFLMNVDGQGSFSEEVVIDEGVNMDINSIATFDIDNDGDQDILICSSGDNKIVWYENTDGLGVFAPQQIISESASEVTVALPVDIDNDGDEDIISTFLGDNALVWFENLEILSNKILGRAILDKNSNDCIGSNPFIENVKIKTDDGIESKTIVTLSNGFYQLFVGEGDFTTSVVPLNYYDISPIQENSSFVGIGTFDTINFCLTPNQIIEDVTVYLTSLSEPRPGFIVNYDLFYKNEGTTELTGDLFLNFDDDKLEFLSSTEYNSSQTDGSLQFQYTDLVPFEIRKIRISFKVFEPPITNLNDLLVFQAVIEPLISDFQPDNNTFEVIDTVIGSYDPNDIQVREGNSIPVSELDEYLHYKIRFQNTGTASAINVRIDNELDENLNWETFDLEGSSHTNRIEIINDNEISFYFDDINLPDSTSNEGRSHGYIIYRIKPKIDLVFGDVIQNQADIYFDFNPPIITNVVSTTITEVSSLSEYNDFEFNVYPIPSRDELNIQTEKIIASVTFYNQLGQSVLDVGVGNEINISKLTTGLYFMKVEDINGDIGIVKIIVE